MEPALAGFLAPMAAGLLSGALGVWGALLVVRVRLDYLEKRQDEDRSEFRRGIASLWRAVRHD